jgi:Ni2+-binding GTPase involved in maturation of urease and hydrogenase
MSVANPGAPSETDAPHPHHPHRSIPVTIVTGFLGAGKTSLLNKLTKHLLGDRSIAVIENEYGAVNLDGKLGAL